MNEFLEASDGWAPFLAFLIVFVVLTLVVVKARTSVADLIAALAERVRAGAKLKLWQVEFGEQPMVTSSKDALAQGAEPPFGRPDLMQLLVKAEGENYSKSTKAMDLPGGCLVQVSTELLSPDGTWTAAEALTFVPGVKVVDDPDAPAKGGRMLVERDT